MAPNKTYYYLRVGTIFSLTTALQYLLTKWLTVTLASVIVIIALLPMCWLLGFYRPLRDWLYEWHGRMGLWFVVVIVAVCLLFCTAYQWLHPHAVVKKEISAGA